MEVRRCKKCFDKPLNEEVEHEIPNEEIIQTQIQICSQIYQEYISSEVERTKCCKKRKCPANVEYTESFRLLLESNKRCCTRPACALAKKFCDIHEPPNYKCVNYSFPGHQKYHYLALDAFTSTDTESDIDSSTTETGIGTQEDNLVIRIDYEQNEESETEENEEENNEALPTQEGYISSGSDDGIEGALFKVENEPEEVESSMVTVMGTANNEEMLSYVTLIDGSSLNIGKLKNEEEQDKSKRDSIATDFSETSDSKKSFTMMSKDSNETVEEKKISNNFDIRMINLERINEDYDESGNRRSILKEGTYQSEKDRNRTSIVSWHIDDNIRKIKAAEGTKSEEKSLEELAQEAALKHQRESIRRRSILKEVVSLADEQMRLSMVGTQSEEQPPERRSRIKSTVDTEALLASLKHPYRQRSGFLGKIFSKRSSKVRGSQDMPYERENDSDSADSSRVEIKSISPRKSTL